MKTTKVFEQNMRECSYASLDSARAGILQRPMAADYLIDFLIDRGVIAVRPDGSVAGAVDARYKERADPKQSVSGEWKEGWPSRSTLLHILGQHVAGIKFRDLQGLLLADDEPASHWITLHALWNLTKAGLVEKEGKKYRLTDAGEVAACAGASPEGDEAWVRNDFDEIFNVWSDPMEATFIKTIRDAEGEHEASFINDMLIADKEGAQILKEAPGNKLSQAFIDYAVKRFTGWGSLP